jgi:catechol 2,3-dioxygenase-like lactoylglutathione lyase family enzyme
MDVDRPGRERITVDIRRVVPNISSDRLEESRAFYVDLLGFEVAMDLGWIVTVASPTNPTAQISLMRQDAAAPMQPQISIEVADVDAVYAAMQHDAEIVYSLTDESWGATLLCRRSQWRGGQLCEPPGSSAPPTASKP